MVFAGRGKWTEERFSVQHLSEARNIILVELLLKVMAYISEKRSSLCYP